MNSSCSRRTVQIERLVVADLLQDLFSVANFVGHGAGKENKQGEGKDPKIKYPQSQPRNNRGGGAILTSGS